MSHHVSVRVFVPDDQKPYQIFDNLKKLGLVLGNHYIVAKYHSKSRAYDLLFLDESDAFSVNLAYG